MIKAYASYFVSYLLLNMKDHSNINKIILFGSAAREEAGKDSDVDIFIDLKKATKDREKEILKILEEFYESREALIFKAKGVDNKINLIIGHLGDWKDLEKSIESSGIALYSRHISSNVKGRKYAVIFWDKIEKNRGALLNKLYGFKVKSKSYKGIVERFKGRKIGKSCIMIPIEFREDVIKIMKKYKANAKIIEVYM